MITKTRRLLVIYSIITIVFVSIVFLNHRGYQDDWILQDVFLPTILYALTFSIVATMIDDNRVVALVCASFIIILNVIPNLKYQLFYGTYDSVTHFGFITNLLSLGFVPQIGFYAPAYSDFPGMHIFMSSFSLILGVNANVSIKFVTSIIFGIIPLMIYLVTNGIFDRNIQRGILIASGLPTVMSYTLFGTTFALPLYFSFFCLLFRRHLSNRNKREYTLTLIIFAFGLLFSHAVTMLFLILFLSAMLILLRFVDLTKKISPYSLSRTTLGILGLLSASFVAWLMHKANFVFETFIEAVQRSFVGEITKAPIPTRFFEIPLLEQLKFFAVWHAKDTVIVVLSLAGFLVLFKKFKSKNDFLVKNFYLPLMCLLGAISLVLAFQFAISFGEIEYRRLIGYAMVFSPFLVGLFLWHVDEHFKTTSKKAWNKVFIVVAILFICILLSIIQIFPYQPLVPKANILSKDLPEDAYIFDFRMVNTIYQERMISFAERFSPGDANITSDRVTRWHIFGFANESLSSKHIWYSPLEPNMNIEDKQWNIFLLHYGERSGPLNEKVEYRTREMIERLRNTLGKVVYDNGESFIISR